ncbi:MAG: hypothetical protein QXO51_04650 [Halobacteria archaeon]
MAPRTQPLRVGWLTICREPESIDLFKSVWDAAQRGDINIRIPWLFINRRPGKSPVTDQLFALAKELGIPAHWFPAREFKWDLYQKDLGEWTLQCDREYMKVLDRAAPVDFMVLGRFMHIWGPEACDRYTMLNLHHATPWGPKRSLDEVLWEHIRNRDAEAGTMLHLTTTDLDRGAPIAYFRFPIGGPGGARYAPHWKAMEGFTERELQANGRARGFFNEAKADIYRREKPFVLETLRRLGTGEIVLQGKVPRFPAETLKWGLDLTDFVEKSLKVPAPAPVLRAA